MNIKQNLLDINLVVDNDWLDKYIGIVENNIGKHKIKFLTCSHHIIPKYYYKYNNIDVDNSYMNIVNLTYSDHILAHYYLMKCSYNNHYTYSNAEAINYMLGTVSEEEKQIINALIDLDTVEYERRKLFYAERRGHITSEEVKGKISRSNKITKRKNRYRYIYKDGVETCVPEHMLDTYIEDGWNIGVLRSSIAWNKGLKTPEHTRFLQSKAKIGKVHIHLDDFTEKLVSKDEVDNYLNNGWVLGRCKKTIDSISINSIGKVGTFKGKHHTNDSKMKISKGNSGGMYIYKGDIVKHVSLVEAELFLADGWLKGNPKSKKKFRWMNNGRECLMVDIDKVQDFIDRGYVIGRLSIKKNLMI